MKWRDNGGIPTLYLQGEIAFAEIDGDKEWATVMLFCNTGQTYTFDGIRKAKRYAEKRARLWIKAQCRKLEKRP